MLAAVVVHRFLLPASGTPEGAGRLSAFSVCEPELVAIATSSSSLDAGNGTKLCSAPVVSATVGAAFALSTGGLAPAVDVDEDEDGRKLVLSVSRRVFVGRGPKVSERMKDCRMYISGGAGGGEKKGLKGASVGCLWMRETRLEAWRRTSTLR